MLSKRALAKTLPDPRRCTEKNPVEALDRVTKQFLSFNFGYRDGNQLLSYRHGGYPRPKGDLLISDVWTGNTMTQGPYGQTLSHLIRQIGVCPDMAGAYLATDFVAIPQIEPPAFPLAAAEAMAMARPVIASNVGALPEIVQAPPRVLESARTGWLAEPDDPVSFARASAKSSCCGTLAPHPSRKSAPNEMISFAAEKSNFGHATPSDCLNAAIAE